MNYQQSSTKPVRTLSSLLEGEPFTPWYREPWAWYIFGILLVTFCWGSIQLYVAFTNQDSVVIDDYYKTGKAINQDLTRTNNARLLGIRAIVNIDDLIGEVRVTVEGSENSWPEQLVLSFLSPLAKSRDEMIILRRTVSGDYVGQLQEQVLGRYYLQLETQDSYVPEIGYETGWKVNAEAEISLSKPVRLYLFGAS